MDSLHTKVNTIDTNLDTALVNQANIESKIDTVDSNVDTMLVNQANIVSEINVNEAKIDALTLSVNTIDTNINTVLTNQGEILTQIDANEAKIDAIVCNPNPCFNGGTCTVVDGATSCQCSSDFTGATCETEREYFLVIQRLRTFTCWSFIVLHLSNVKSETTFSFKFKSL